MVLSGFKSFGGGAVGDSRSLSGLPLTKGGKQRQPMEGFETLVSNASDLKLSLSEISKSLFFSLLAQPKLPDFSKNPLCVVAVAWQGLFFPQKKTYPRIIFDIKKR